MGGDDVVLECCGGIGRALKGSYGEDCVGVSVKENDGGSEKIMQEEGGKSRGVGLMSGLSKDCEG